MVDYRIKLGTNFDLSTKQIEILERDKDTLVRALPGSGKTTILTLKIKNLLIDNPLINKICCISYTNVNVEDLELSCSQIINSQDLNKVEFLTFHKFCLQYVLRPYSYLYKNHKGLRPYKKIFDFSEHGTALIDFLNEEHVEADEVSKISDGQKIFYNLKFTEGSWKPVSSSHKPATVAKYLKFLSLHKLIDFNLINLLSLFIIQENHTVKRALNKALEWVFIDEFQDISEIQCKIIEALSTSRVNEKLETKWFVVGDPNQSIYGFAGANPRSMYDMKVFFNNLHSGENCEIKLEKSHRCSDEVFKFTRDNYNLVLNKIKTSSMIRDLHNKSITDYLDDLEISEDLHGNGDNGRVIVKTTISAVSEIMNLKFNELVDQEVCCIGINKYNSIDVYKQYMLHDSANVGEGFSLYAEIYKDYEDKFGFKYFSIFIKYLILKYHFYKNRLKYSRSLDKFTYSLELLISEKLNLEISKSALLSIVVDSIDIQTPLDSNKTVFEEFMTFSNRLTTTLKSSLALDVNQQAIFVTIADTDKMVGIQEPTLEGFLKYITRSRSENLTFEIKYIHKIKGLEYEQVIVQRIEDLPHKSNYGLHGALFWRRAYQPSVDDIYNYIQELNKLYVMLTRPRKNLYIIKNQYKQYNLLSI